MLIDLFKEHGKSVDLSNSRDFVPNKDTHFYYICKGSVEVFSNIKENPHTEKRLHKFTANVGEIIFGISENMGELLSCIYLSCTEETIIFEVPLDVLVNTCKKEVHVNYIAKLIDNWLNNLSFGLSNSVKTRVIPTELIKESSESICIEGDILSVSKQLAWVKLCKGMLVYMGLEDYKPDNQKLIPLTLYSWFDVLDNSHIQSFSTAELIRKGTIWENIQNFHHLFATCDIWNYRLNTADDLNILNQKTKYEKNLISNSFKIFTKKQTKHSNVLNIDHSLIATCFEIINYLNIPDIDINKIPESKKNNLKNIAMSLNIRYRKVVFKNSVPSDLFNPILCYLKKNNRPIAIFPSKGKYFRVFDPSTNDFKFVIKSNILNIINNHGYILYKSLKTKNISRFDLLKTSLNNTKNDLFLVFITSFFGGIISLSPSIAVVIIFKSIIPFSEKTQLLHLTYIYIFLALVSILFHITRNMALLRICLRIDYSIQTIIWDRLLNLPVSFFRKFLIGDLAQRALGITTIKNKIGQSFISLIPNTIFVIFNLIILFYFNWILTCVLLVPIFIFSFFVFLEAKHYTSIETKALNKKGRFSGFLIELINGISKIKSAGAENRSFFEWTKKFNVYSQTLSKAKTIKIKNKIYLSILYILSLIIIFSSSVFISVPTYIFLGFFVAYINLMLLFNEIIKNFFSIIETLITYDRVKPIFTSELEPRNKSILENLQGKIELNNVSFRYNLDSPLVLDDISFQIEPGEFCAIVGPSGSGKSTLISLLLGFLSPITGSIYYDNYSLENLDIQNIRKHLGVVLQEAKLLPGNIFSNIVGSRDLNNQDAWEAARLAAIDKDIIAFPMQMETVVTGKAEAFSDGQKQRILIARALINEPKVLLLDEATNNLDNYTKEIITKNIKSLKVTRIVITHSLNTIKNADKIIVLNKGKLVQIGNFESLKNKEGLFKDLVQ
jgi:NHLM bacteriocin system ABC transporter ATP-binding protein